MYVCASFLDLVVKGQGVDVKNTDNLKAWRLSSTKGKGWDEVLSILIVVEKETLYNTKYQSSSTLHRND